MCEAGSSDDEIAKLGLTLNRMLERLEEAANRQQLFAAAASHELRSPLSAIRTELEVGLAYPDRAEWTKVAEDSLIEVARLEELTRDLRTADTVAVDAGLGSRPIELSELVAVRGRSASTRARGPLRRRRESGSRSPQIPMLSFGSCATCSTTPNDTRRARYASWCRADPNGVTLSVANDGPAIPAAELERIFEPFMRLDEARSLDIGGSGLGLAIARSIMTALGGSIIAVAVDHGAEFRATFPAQVSRRVSFGPLALVVAAGLVGPLLASAHRFGPPMIVGEIAAGVVIGVSGFGWIEPNDPLLTGLPAIGFALLMFIVGTHLPVRDRRLRSALARRRGRGSDRRAVGRCGGGAAGIVGRAATVRRCLLCSWPRVPVRWPCRFSRISVRPTVRRLSRSAWIAIADVVTVLALPVVLATGGMWRVVTGGALVVLAGVGMLVLAQLVRNRPWVQRMRTLSRDRGWGLDLRVSLLALFTCAWIAHRFGTSSPDRRVRRRNGRRPAR